MAIAIAKKIVGYNVVAQDQASDSKTPAPAEPTPAVIPAPAPTTSVVQMHESLERPEVLAGTTYKVKSPLVEHALYVTINDMVLNVGTADEERRPFEMFINSKNMEQFQWIVALTRVMSAVFRKGGDVTFLVEELRAVFDPRGGYFRKGGEFMPSIVAELGAVIEQHLKSIGMIGAPELTDAQRSLIAEKRAAFERQEAAKAAPAAADAAACNCTSAECATGQCAAPDAQADSQPSAETNQFPATATMCDKCSTKALVVMDNCATCLNCGFSKCG